MNGSSGRDVKGIPGRCKSCAGGVGWVGQAAESGSAHVCPPAVLRGAVQILQFPGACQDRWRKGPYPDRSRSGDPRAMTASRRPLVALPETRQLDVLANLLERREVDVLRCPMIAIEDSPDTAGVVACLERL